jgi:CheY-like chemotaxis protein
MVEDKKRIIIVEDEPDTIEMFAEMMRLSGYFVLKSYGGPPALKLISEENPDVVVMDIMMPEFSGMDVLDHMQKNPDLRGIPVIIVSAKSLPRDIQAGLDAGAVAYLTKPVTFQQLSEAVQTTLDEKLGLDNQV